MQTQLTKLSGGRRKQKLMRKSRNRGATGNKNSRARGTPGERRAPGREKKHVTGKKR